jgi:hypothetical protein
MGLQDLKEEISKEKSHTRPARGSVYYAENFEKV